jgi:hypothetical protein
VDSTLQVLEEEIKLDWSNQSQPYQILLPASISISFSIAPDGSVYDITVAVPQDSFFSDFVPEIERRVATLRFESSGEEACETIQLDVVLY